MDAPTEARWLVVTLPRQDGTQLTLYLVSPTDDPETVAAVEAAALAAQMTLLRVGPITTETSG